MAAQPSRNYGMRHAHERSRFAGEASIAKLKRDLQRANESAAQARAALDAQNLRYAVSPSEEGDSALARRLASHRAKVPLENLL